jgi:hypothetical protein
MFESVGNFFDSVGSFFRSGYDTVKDFVGGAYDSAKGAVSGVYDTGKTIVVTLHDDVVSYAKGVKDVATSTIKEGGSVIRHGEDTIEGIGKSFAFPLAIAAGVVGFAYLNKK